MQVIGICRFSYPAIGGFQVRSASLAERRAYLYDPDRMATRFALFEAFTLPSIRAQTDADFVFLIVVGDSLPRRYSERLRDLVKDIPQIVVQRHAPGPHREVMNDALNALRSNKKAPCIQFRLDDDDAVARGFVAELRRRAVPALQILEDSQSVAIDFNQGYIARPNAEGIEAAAVKESYWAAGMAIVTRPKSQQTIMSFSHNKIWQHMPTLTFTGTDMMLRGIHPYNDSRQKTEPRPVQLQPLDAAGEVHFKMTYNIDADNVRRLFSAPH
ncbi:putative rhamnosyl transferase [uncultured Roseobacter sp.]|uniref:putative rhamnosyl transferase n=1 Tax=uncultured Roseobacter sp. TaxID=114847 RepID=UPI002630BB82|nr:putative rhamnosyl transferase [uncultured Roseobacter sp.]